TPDGRGALVLADTGSDTVILLEFRDDRPGRVRIPPGRYSLVSVAPDRLCDPATLDIRPAGDTAEAPAIIATLRAGRESVTVEIDRPRTDPRLPPEPGLATHCRSPAAIDAALQPNERLPVAVQVAGLLALIPLAIAFGDVSFVFIGI
ncbi:MAG: hypothetical protein AAFZ09_01450, partial [Pseudomonadota bacterium]